MCHGLKTNPEKIWQNLFKTNDGKWLLKALIFRKRQVGDLRCSVYVKRVDVDLILLIFMGVNFGLPKWRTLGKGAYVRKQFMM